MLEGPGQGRSPPRLSPVTWCVYHAQDLSFLTRGMGRTAGPAASLHLGCGSNAPCSHQVALRQCGPQGLLEVRLCLIRAGLCSPVLYLSPGSPQLSSCGPGFKPQLCSSMLCNLRPEMSLSELPLCINNHVSQCPGPGGAQQWRSCRSPWLRKRQTRNRKEEGCEQEARTSLWGSGFPGQRSGGVHLCEDHKTTPVGG